LANKISTKNHLGISEKYVLNCYTSSIIQRIGRLLLTSHKKCEIVICDFERFVTEENVDDFGEDIYYLASLSKN